MMLLICKDNKIEIQKNLYKETYLFWSKSVLCSTIILETKVFWKIIWYNNISLQILIERQK
jgi:hypothetical protein